MSYALLRSRRRPKGLGEDPHPLCTDPNQYKDSATCAETACKQGYAATVTGDCVLVATPGAGETIASALPSVCASADGTWDESRGQCVRAAEDTSSDEGWGTRLFGGPSGDGGSGSGFDPGATKPTLASVARDAAPWAIAAGVGLLVFFARPA